MAEYNAPSPLLSAPLVVIPHPLQRVHLATTVAGPPLFVGDSAYSEKRLAVATVWRKSGSLEYGFPGSAGLLFADGHIDTINEWPGTEFFEVK